MSSPTEMLADLTDALWQWLPEQRWFAGKDRPVLGVTVVRTTTLRGHNGGGDDPELLHAVIAVDQGGAEPDHYQLLLGLRRELPEHLGHAWVATGDSRAVYDATHDPGLTARLLELIAHNSEIDGLRFVTEPGAEVDAVHRSRPVGVEQSHTSLIYGHAYILKLFRRLMTGPSPDLELHRALDAVGCPHIAAPLGAIEGRLDGASVTLGMLNEYLPNTADGWAMATASIRDLLAETESSAAGAHPEDVGGDFASEAHRLGNAVATVHRDLARALGRTEAGSGELPRVAAGMHRRLDAVLASVPSLAEHETALRAAFDQVAALSGPVTVQRAHGDLHLGQVLRAVTGWVLIDFEGEPAAPLAERIEPVSPLRDVAGMLRSFDYAAHHMLIGETEPGPHSDAAREWAGRNQQAFCDGYAEGGEDPRSQPALLRAFELDKAVYEVGYEYANRPAWLPIPLAAIARIAGHHDL
ncbi:MAG: aminoglycoside phosphotransferase [Pseudonocardiaceae bacterium]|nr:aminoglycoside phosphotransferase [Pseudonocardiaceae bacterium]